MRHHHHHHHDHGGQGQASKNILLAFFLNLFFSIVELIGGLWTGSIAILSDALHDAGDSISLAVAWRLEKISQKGRDARYSYGYRRFALLGALFISMVLLIGSIFVIKESIEKLISPGEPNAVGMIGLAIFGLLVNGFAAYRLSRGGSLSERSVMLHMMEDVLGWTSVLVVSIVMYFVELPILDPLLSLALSAWILYNVYFNLRDTLRILLQRVPDGLDLRALEESLRALPAVDSIHDLHVWTLDGEEHIVSLHISYDDDLVSSAEEMMALKSKVRALAEEFHLHHLTIELDPKGQSCGMEHCSKTCTGELHNHK